jgi:hypothetical protein
MLEYEINNIILSIIHPNPKRGTKKIECIMGLTAKGKLRKEATDLHVSDTN